MQLEEIFLKYTIAKYLALFLNRITSYLCLLNSISNVILDFHRLYQTNNFHQRTEKLSDLKGELLFKENLQSCICLAI